MLTHSKPKRTANSSSLSSSPVREMFPISVCGHYYGWLLCSVCLHFQAHQVNYFLTNRFNGFEGPRWFRNHLENTLSALLFFFNTVIDRRYHSAETIFWNLNSWSQFSLCLHPEGRMHAGHRHAERLYTLGANWNSLQGEKEGSLSRAWFATSLFSQHGIFLIRALLSAQTSSFQYVRLEVCLT